MSRAPIVLLLLLGALAAGCAPASVGGDRAAADSPAPDAGRGDATDGVVDAPDAAVVDHGDAAAICTSIWSAGIQSGTALDDQILGMALDANDNLYVTGYEGGTNRVSNIEPSGDARAVVIKYNPAGKLLWKTTLDTPATETAQAVALDPSSDNLVVVGRTSGAFEGFVNQGQFDLFLAVLRPSGQIVSNLQLGNERPQHPLRLSVSSEHRIVATGLDDTYIPSNFVAAPEDGFVASFQLPATGGGAVAPAWWQYLNPNPGPLSAYTRITDGVLERDGSGALYVVGAAPPPLGGAFAMKLDADGAVVWHNVILPLQIEAASAVGLSPSGELFVAGGTLRQLGMTSFGQEDAYLMKLDKATGETIWATQAGGPDSELATSLGFDALGNIYIAGTTLGSVVPGIANQGSGDLFAMKLDATGQLVGSWQAGTSSDDEVTSIAVTTCGQALIAGFTGGDLFAQNPHPGTDDMFIVAATFSPSIP